MGKVRVPRALVGNVLACLRLQLVLVDMYIRTSHNDAAYRFLLYSVH